MSAVKHMAINHVRKPRNRHRLKARRKRANLNPKYLENLITQHGA
jgi:hypothetical protein